MICKHCKEEIFSYHVGEYCLNSGDGRHEPAEPVAEAAMGRAAAIAAEEEDNYFPPEPADSTPQKYRERLREAQALTQKQINSGIVCFGCETENICRALKRCQIVRDEANSTRPAYLKDCVKEGVDCGCVGNCKFDSTRTEPLSAEIIAFLEEAQMYHDEQGRWLKAEQLLEKLKSAAPRTQPDTEEDTTDKWAELCSRLGLDPWDATVDLMMEKVAPRTQGRELIKQVAEKCVERLLSRQWPAWPECVRDISAIINESFVAQPQPVTLRPNLELISAAICQEVYGPYMATVDADHRAIAIKAIVRVLQPFFTAIPAAQPAPPVICQCGDGGCIDCCPANFTKIALIAHIQKLHQNMRAQPAPGWISVNDLPNGGKGSRQWYWVTDGELYDVAILVHGKFVGHRGIDAMHWMLPFPLPAPPEPAQEPKK